MFRDIYSLPDRCRFYRNCVWGLSPDTGNSLHSGIHQQLVSGHGRVRRLIPTWALNCLGILYLPFCILDYLLLSGSFMSAIFHLLLFSAAIKLLTLSKDRDYILLYVISLGELLARPRLQ